MRSWMAGLITVSLSLTALAQDTAKLPDFKLVERCVDSHFAAIKDHQAEDLISRDQAEPLFEELAKHGWQVAEREEIVAQLLPKGDPLVKRLRTKSGKTFMRQASSYSQAYDRLDHLERLSDGPRILDRLIDGPDGYKLIEYLTTSSGGKNMGKMLSNAPHGEKFNKPTGRIYTQEQLLARLKESHAAAQTGGGSPARRSR